MAKVIKYKFLSTENENGQIFLDKVISFSETNEEIAKKEAWGGEYTIEDDGQEVDALTLDDRVATLETDSTEMKEALDMILSGVTE